MRRRPCPSLRATAAASFALLSLSAVPDARATSTAAPVHVAVDPCVPVPPARILDMLGLELHGTTLQPPGATASATQVRLLCGGADTVEIAVRDPVTDKALTRSVALGGVQANARARLLALAIAELVSASSIELDEPPARPAPPPSKAAGSPLVAGAIDRARLAEPRPDPLRVGALLTGRLVDGRTSLVGAGLQLAAPWQGAVFTADAVFERGQRVFAFGRVQMNAFSAGGLVQIRRALGRSWVAVGGGLRGGVVVIRGDGVGPTTRDERLIAPWAGPILTATGAVPLWPRGAAALSLETGHAAISARGQVMDQGDRQAGGLGLTGLWVGLSLCVSHGT